MYDLIAETADQIFIPLTVGGGVRSPEDVRKMLEHGADKVSINTAAIESPQVISDSARRFGPQCIVVAMDAKKIADSKWEIYTHGGRNATGLDAIEWAQQATDRGAGELLITSMDTDGHQEGYDIDLLRTVRNTVDVPIIASGGAGTPEHLYDALTVGGADAVLAASIFHFGKYTIQDLKNYLQRRGLPMRPVE